MVLGSRPTIIYFVLERFCFVGLRSVYSKSVLGTLEVCWGATGKCWVSTPDCLIVSNPHMPMLSHFFYGQQFVLLGMAPVTGRFMAQLRRNRGSMGAMRCAQQSPTAKNITQLKEKWCRHCRATLRLHNKTMRFIFGVIFHVWVPLNPTLGFPALKRIETWTHQLFSLGSATVFYEQVPIYRWSTSYSTGDLPLRKRLKYPEGNTERFQHQLHFTRGHHWSSNMSTMLGLIRPTARHSDLRVADRDKGKNRIPPSDLYIYISSSS